MQIEQLSWRSAGGWRTERGALDGDADLVLAFGARALLDAARHAELAARYPRARLLGCTTAGEVCGDAVEDDGIVATAVRFAHSRVALARVELATAGDSAAAGRALAAQLPAAGLVHVFVLADGLQTNGTELLAGLTGALPAGVAVTGGLAGDGTAFAQTGVLADAPPASGVVAALGLYGERLAVGYGSLGGWDSFGPDRVVTRAEGNVLYELDGQPALDLYKRYLGEFADGLPASGLLFPLALQTPGQGGNGLVRTMLAVDETQGSMSFAGGIPTGAHVRLMKANFERLVEGAEGAARSSRERLGEAPAELAVLISCVGRKLVLQQRIDEEIEGVRDVLGPQPVFCGFYSYGEISPFTPTARCELHNQTMTITTLAER